MDREIAARLRWVRMYHETSNTGLVCARCGIFGRHFANGYVAIRKLAKQVSSLKAVVHCAAQTGRSPKLIGRRYFDYALNAKAHGGSRVN